MIDIIVCCYNQEKFIKKTMQSIYSQILDVGTKVNLIIADDSSPDRTLEIIKSIEKPDWANLNILENNGNLGFVKNYQRAYKECKGDYVLILEGDDWWHDPNHMKKHIDYLKTHPEISMTMNRITTYSEATEETKTYDWDETWGDSKEYNLQEQIFINRLGNLSSCCFRGQYIRDLPEKLFNIRFADWLMGIIMAQYGNIAILKDSTSTYRVHPKGQWSGMDYVAQNEKILECAKLYDKFFEGKYKKDFDNLKSTVQLNIEIWNKQKNAAKTNPKAFAKKVLKFFWIRKKKVLLIFVLLAAVALVLAKIGRII